jgi:hypothetical protein
MFLLFLICYLRATATITATPTPTIRPTSIATVVPTSIGVWLFNS